MLASSNITRFAPSPNGFLHLGHAYAASVACEAAGAGGRFLLRIEDLDGTRCRPEYEAAICEDLAWLGLLWQEPVLRQSERFGFYKEALSRLDGMGVLYPCFCTRRAIAEEAARSTNAPHGPEGPLYPGTCRGLDEREAARRIAAGEGYGLRLDVGRALELTGPLVWEDRGKGRQEARPELLGDVILVRKEVPASYHLCVVVDDAALGVTLVTRGRDLFDATHLHRLLQALLGLPAPHYFHHPLVVDAEGRRLSKRDRSLAVRALRAAGKASGDVLEMARGRLEKENGAA
jgi:glutamyl-Q tRNA(Asp) synthetase